MPSEIDYRYRYHRVRYRNYIHKSKHK